MVKSISNHFLYAAEFGFSGNLVILQEMLSSGAQIDARDHDGRTALILTVRRACQMPRSRRRSLFQVMSALLAKHANVNCLDNRGLGALGWSILYGREDIAEFLLAHGAGQELRN